MSEPDVVPPGAAPRLAPAAWLLATPLVVALAIPIARGAGAGLSHGLADASAFLLGALVSVGPLAAAAPARLGRAVALALVVASACAVIACRFLASALEPIAVTSALVVVAHVGGGAIGRRIQHPGHLLPACIVAAAADFSSVIHPGGPSHAIAGSPSALALLAVQVPVPGADGAWAPVLGLGDLVFLALVLGAAAAHGLSIARVALLGLAGVLLAGFASAMLEAAVPALIAIAAMIALGLPEARRQRPPDRRVTGIVAALAAGVVVSVVIARLASSGA